MSNKMRTARTTKPMGTAITKNSGTGVIGKNQSPGWGQYSQSIGKDTIPTKFAETGIGSAMTQTNKMRNSAPSASLGKASMPKTSTMKTSKNDIRSARSTKPMGNI